MHHDLSNARRSTLVLPTRRLGTASAAVLAAALLAACGGGGSGVSTVPQNPVSPPGGNPQSTQSLGITFAGTQTLAKVRRPQDLAATPVTVTVNGVVVGSGTLDGNGHAKIAFTVSVAPGATIVVKAGQLTVTTTIATTSQNTAALVTVKADGTVTVTTAADPGGNGPANTGAVPQHIGIVGCSAEGASLCYRTICTEGAQLLGPHAHPEVTLHTPSLAEYMTHIYCGDWESVGELMLASARKLAVVGELGFHRIGLTGTRWLVESEVYPRSWLRAGWSTFARTPPSARRSTASSWTSWCTASSSPSW